MKLVLHQGIIYRTPIEVTVERAKIAEYLSKDGKGEDVYSQSISQEFLALYFNTSEMDTNTRLQLKISIFNKVSAEQVLQEYENKASTDIYNKS